MNLSPLLRRAALCLLVLGVALPAQAERIKDLAQVGGVRGNALVGYGWWSVWMAAVTAPARRRLPCRA